MSIVVTSTTDISITVSCSYPPSTTIPGNSRTQTASQSCTVTWGWVCAGSDSKTQTSSQSCTVTWEWVWIGGGWQFNSSSDNSPSSIYYGPDGQGYEGTLNRTSVDRGTQPSPPTGTGFNGETRTKTTTGTAYYSGTVTKIGVWQDNGVTHNAPSSISYGPDSENYSGTLNRTSVSLGSRPSPPSGSCSTTGQTTTSTTTGTANYSGTVSQPDTTSGATITQAEMYRNGSYVGVGGSSNSFSYTFSGLLPGTTYSLSVWWYSFGSNLDADTTSGTTTGTPASNAGTFAEGFSYNQYQWYIYNLTNAFNTTYYMSAAVFNAPFANGSASEPPGKISSVSAPASGSDTSTPLTMVTGATSAGNTYTAYGGVRAANGSWYTAGSATFTSPNGAPNDFTPPNATISFSDNTSSITINWSAVDPMPPGGSSPSGFNRIDFRMSEAGGGTTYFLTSSFTASSSINVTATPGTGTPLQPNTLYAFEITVSDVEGNPQTYNRTHTTGAPIRPDNFAWDTAKISGQPVNITASEWNNLRSRIQAFRTYKNLPPYSFSHAALPGADITAFAFNDMRSAIASMAPPPSLPSLATSGGTIFALQINGLRDSLNAII